MIDLRVSPIYLTSHESSLFKFGWNQRETKYRLWSEKPKLKIASRNWNSKIASYPDWDSNEEIGLLEVGKITVLDDKRMTYKITGSSSFPKETFGEPEDKVNIYKLEWFLA